jgi:hypothetical protein
MSEFINRIPPLVRVPLRYGLIGGALGFLVVVVLYYIGRHSFLINPFFDFRVALFGVLMFFILKELRDYHFGGLLFFWQGIAACAIFVITFGVLASLLTWIFAINVPHFVIQYVELATNQLKTYPKETIEKIGKSVFDQQLVELKSTTAFDLAKLYFGQGILIGLFVSVIISVILRRQPAIS